MRVPSPMRQLYLEDAPMVVVMKGAQMGVSEWVLDMALHTADTMRARRGTSLYVQPGGANVGDFVQGRVTPIIEASEDWLAVRIPEAGTKSPNKVGLRKVGPGLTYWRTAHVKGRGGANRSGLKSVPVDTLILDEFDEMPDDTIALASHRLDSSQEPWTRVISTPTYPGAGIEPLYLAGDRRRYMLTCDECDTEQALEWDTNVEERDGEFRRVCSRCRESLEPLIERVWRDDTLGRWVASNPEGEYPSYHISQLYRPRLDLAAIHAVLTSSDLTKRQEGWNQHLGLPFSPPGGQLSLEELARASSAPFTFDDIAGVQGCLLGVDVGVKLHCWLEWISDQWTDEPQRYLVGALELDSFAEVDELMRRFGVIMAVVDARPELRMAQALQQRHPGQVYLAEYVQDRMPPLILGAHEEDPKRRYHVQVDRTALMDAAASNIRDCNVLMPSDAPTTPGLFAHLQAPVRLLKITATQTNPRAVYEEGAKADHWYHAAGYAELALYIARQVMPVSYIDGRQFRSSQL